MAKAKRNKKFNRSREDFNVVTLDSYRNVHKKITVLPRNVKQEDYLLALQDGSKDVVFAVGPAGTGKAQPLDAKIRTLNGWTTMGEIKIGDKIVSADGQITNVVGVYPQGKKEIVRITFEDGRYAECCLEHLWKVYNYDWGGREKSKEKRWRVVDTHEIKRLLQLKSYKNRLYIPLIKNEAHYTKSNVPMDPYFLGLLLGDGYLKTDLCISTADNEILSYVKLALDQDYELKHTSAYDYRIKSVNPIKGKQIKGQFRNKYKQILFEMGILGKGCDEKFIPEVYKNADYNTRLSLLQGLMDTDGTADHRYNNISYCTVSEQLAHDVQELVWSLGGICKIKKRKSFFTYKGMKKRGLDKYCLSIRLPNPRNAFKLSRKKDLVSKRSYQYDNLKLRIKSIESIGFKEAQCIMIDHPDHLYITDNYVVTHNTMLGTQMAIKQLWEKKIEKIVITRPNRAVDDKDIGFLPGDIFSKMQPWMMPVLDVFKEYYTPKQVQEMLEQEIIEIVPIAYVRGRTFKNAWIIVDEAQGTTPNSMLALLTRIGEGSKMVITGDTNQSDHGDANGLSDFLKKWDSSSDRIAVIEFSNKEVERHPVVKDILKMYGQ